MLQSPTTMDVLSLYIIGEKDPHVCVMLSRRLLSLDCVARELFIRRWHAMQSILTHIMSYFDIR